MGVHGEVRWGRLGCGREGLNVREKGYEINKFVGEGRDGVLVGGGGMGQREGT